MSKLRSIIILSSSFLAGEAFGGIAASFVKVYWLRLMDPKYFKAPSLAFQIEIFGVLFLLIISATCLCVSLFFKRKYLFVSPPLKFQFALFQEFYILYHSCPKQPFENVG